MSRSFVLAICFRAVTKRTSFLQSLALIVLFSFTAGANAQFGAPSSGTPVKDTSALHPPAGARVAIVEFSDFECPACGHANPTLMAATAKYKIPWLRYDFPLPQHTWSFTAAVNARWFDTHSKSLGDEYRNQVFANQNSIYSPGALTQFTAKFAADHHIALPFAIDPQGKLAAAVKADYALGQRTGVVHTPTIWVVTSSSKGSPFIEVERPDQDLYRIIDQAIADTASRPAPAKAPVHKPAGK